jgi:hypothetical protein
VSDLSTLRYRPFDHPLAFAWVKAFYGDWSRFVWEESSYYVKGGDAPEVRHFRVFCNPAWEAVIPRGEVYTRDFTEKGWKSFSEKQYNIVHPSELDE